MLPDDDRYQKKTMIGKMTSVLKGVFTRVIGHCCILQGRKLSNPLKHYRPEMASQGGRNVTRQRAGRHALAHYIKTLRRMDKSTALGK